MSIYFVKGKGWRYDFTLNGKRYTDTWFSTKREVKEAEARKKEEINNPKPIIETPTDMVFLDLVNIRLDYVKAYNSEDHYRDYRWLSKGWVKRWGKMPCCEITQDMVQRYILEIRRKISAYTANKNIRDLRATFNFGKKKRLIRCNPVDGIEFLPEEKKVKYVPPAEDIDRVIEAADPDTQDYLWVLRETMGRMSEINRMSWDDVNLEMRFVILYTRKKKGGHLTPRKVPMTEKLHQVLSERYFQRDMTKPWVFWHTYWSRRAGSMKHGPYLNRHKFMKTLCKKAGVKYFRFHPLRHSGASIMDNNNVPIRRIQKILGHENQKTTEIYLHSIGEQERLAMAVYEQARQKSHTDSHTDKNKGLSPRS
ncbi:MAG: tyrosine-type recombinase/integrase [bacterium]